MDFSSLLRLKNKQSLWIDVAFYLAVSILMAVVFCYFIFLIRIFMQKSQITWYETKMTEIGTDEQKQYESEIFSYQKKIKDYSAIIVDHKFSSNIFLFLEELTLPDVWFNKFNMLTKDNSVSLSGEADSMESLSKQISYFEKSEYIKKISLLNSSLGNEGKVGFNLNIVLDSSLFSISSVKPSESEENSEEPAQTEQPTQTEETQTNETPPQ